MLNGLRTVKAVLQAINEDNPIQTNPSDPPTKILMDRIEILQLIDYIEQTMNDYNEIILHY